MSKLKCERNEAYNEWLEYVQIVTLRRVKLERAESDERVAKAKLDDLNAALVKEQEAGK